MTVFFFLLSFFFALAHPRTPGVERIHDYQTKGKIGKGLLSIVPEIVLKTAI